MSQNMQPVEPVRRIVTADDAGGRGIAIQDGPAPGVRTDPARPGYASTHIWTTDRTPARLPSQAEPLGDQSDALEPPPGGSVFRIVSVPPDTSHPYMLRTRTLDFCLIMEGEITLVLDEQEVQLQAGDTVVQRGTNHAWSNRSDRPCVIAISSHDGVQGSSDDVIRRQA